MFGSVRRRNLRNTFALVTSAISLALANVPAAMALGNGEGVFTPGQCNGATALFHTFPAGNPESQYGFDGDPQPPYEKATQAAEITNAGAGKAGFSLDLSYKKKPPTTDNDFRQLSVFFKDDGRTRRSLVVHFCFRFGHGEGNTTAVDKKLSEFSISPAKFGWNRASINSLNFGGLDVRNAVLTRLTFSLDQTRGNLTWGNTTLQIGSGGQVIPVEMDLNTKDCSILDTCAVKIAE